MLIPEIRKRLTDFVQLCKAHKVKSLYVFGSAVTDNFNPATSDYDLLVDIDETDPIEKGEKLISLWDKLETMFQRKVDLLTDASIKNPVLRKNIDQTKILIYDGNSAKVPG